MRLQKDQWGIPRSLENVQSRGQKQRLELFLPCACKWVKDVLWAPGQHERGALSNRDLLCASEEASWGPGREHIAAPNGGPISSREFFFNFSNSNILVVVQLLNYFWLFATPWTAASQASLSFTITQSLLQLMPIELVMPSNHLILCRLLLLLPSIFPSIRVFSNESTLCMRWPKYWSFSFNISPSKEHPGLITFRMN